MPRADFGSGRGAPGGRQHGADAHRPHFVVFTPEARAHAPGGGPAVNDVGHYKVDTLLRRLQEQSDDLVDAWSRLAADDGPPTAIEPHCSTRPHGASDPACSFATEQEGRRGLRHGRAEFLPRATGALERDDDVPVVVAAATEAGQVVRRCLVGRRVGLGIVVRLEGELPAAHLTAAARPGFRRFRGGLVDGVVVGERGGCTLSEASGISCYLTKVGRVGPPL